MNIEKIDEAEAIIAEYRDHCKKIEEIEYKGYPDRLRRLLVGYRQRSIQELMRELETL